MSEKSMWGGRFSASPAELMQEYTESVSFDKALYRHDIAGSKAHATMLAKQGILTVEEKNTLVDEIGRAHV